MLVERNKDNDCCEMTTAEYCHLCLLLNIRCNPHETEAMAVIIDGSKRIKIIDIYRGKVTYI